MLNQWFWGFLFVLYFTHRTAPKIGKNNKEIIYFLHY